MRERLTASATTRAKLLCLGLGLWALAMLAGCNAEIIGYDEETADSGPVMDARSPDSMALDTSAEGPSSEADVTDTSTEDGSFPIDSPDSMSDSRPTEACAPGPVAIAPPAGTYSGAVTVSLSDQAPDASIYYTTNGTNPSTSSTLYQAPFSVSASEEVRAIAASEGCTSAVAQASYVITPSMESSAPTTPTFSPTATIQNNDFLVAIAADVGATICYTLDGSTASCANGVCTGTSTRYTGNGSEIAINGSITTNGSITLSAIACSPGEPPSAVATQTYTLQVATPTMVNPSPGTLPFLAAGYNPTLATATVPSGGASMLDLRYTASASSSGPAPSCTVGTLSNAPTTVPVSSIVTIQAVGCKTGYRPSAIASFTYGVQLNAPTFPATGKNGAPGTYDGLPPAFDLVDQNAGLPVADWMCVVTSASAPACGATMATCAGSASAVLAPFAAPLVTSTGTTIQAVACAVGYVGSAVASGTYVLQLDTPALWNPSVTPAGPGCIGPSGVVSCTAPKTVVTPPVVSYPIPAAADGVFTANVQQDFGVPIAGSPQAWDYACATAAGTAACGPAGTCKTGQIVSGPFNGNGAPLGGPNTVQPGQAWTVQGCFDLPTFAPSLVTTVAFTPSNISGTPIFAPAATGPYTTPISPVIVNVDTTAPGQTLCYTTDGTTPSCSNATCGPNTSGATTQVLAVSASGAASGVGFTGGSGPNDGVVLTAGGSGYTTAPTVTFSAPPAGGMTATGMATLNPGGVTTVTVTQGGTGYSTPPAVAFTGGGGSGAVATANLSGNVVSSITVTNPGSGYTTAPTVTLTGGDGGSGASAVAGILASPVAALVVTNPGAGYTSPPTITFSGGGGTGAAATAYLANAIQLPPQQKGADTVRVVACSSAESQSAVGSQVYDFQLAEPDLTIATAAGSETGNFDMGGTIGAGQTLTLSTASSFSGVTLYYNTGSAPTNCTGTNGGTPLTGTSGQVIVGGPSIPLGTTTLNVIACGPVQTSPVRTVTLQIVAATPTIACPGVTPSSALGTIDYQNTVNCSFAEASAAVQPATTICYHSDGTTPSCASGVCDTASTVAVNGASVPVAESNTQIVAIACAPNLTPSSLATATINLSVTPVVLSGSGTCPETVTVGLDQTMASAPPSGPTHDATICYSVDGTVPSLDCYNDGLGTIPADITCFSSGSAGAETSSISLSIQPTTVRTVTCAPGFAGAVASSTYTFTPFSFTPGSLAEFAPVAASTELESTHNGDAAYVAYDASNLYVGVGSTSPGSSASWTPASTTFVVVYLNDGTAQGTMTGPSVYGSPALATPATFLLAWETDDAVAPQASVWTGTTWTAASFMPTAQYNSGSKVLLTVALSAIDVSAELTLEGAIVKNVGVGPSTYETFPVLGTLDPDYSHFVAAALASCKGPAAQVQ